MSFVLVIYKLGLSYMYLKEYLTNPQIIQKKENYRENLNYPFAFFSFKDLSLITNPSNIFILTNNYSLIRNLYCSYFNSIRCSFISSETPHTLFLIKKYLNFALGTFCILYCDSWNTCPMSITPLKYSCDI